MIVVGGLFISETNLQPNIALNYNSNDVVAGQPISFYWQLNHMNADCVLLVSRSGKRIKLKPDVMNNIYGKGGFTVTFSKKERTTLRLMALDTKNKKMCDQVFAITPAEQKTPEYQDNIKI